MEITAKLNHLRIAPRKVRFIAEAVKRQSVTRALHNLERLPNRPAKSLAKLTQSAATNAKHNFGIEKEELYIKDIRVNQGPALKRYLPRALGKADTVKKYSSHVTLVLETREVTVGLDNKKKGRKKEQS